MRRTLLNGRVESVTWDDLVEVGIVTTSEGPVNEDVFFVLHGATGSGCVVSQGHPLSGQLLIRLQALPGFDNEKVIEAMGSTGDATFTCWRKPT